MRILFFCGSVEYGNDGVGDYTRLLCGELIRLGHEAQILSLCDPYVSEYLNEIQEVGGNKVVVNRLPLCYSHSKRYTIAQDIVAKYQPDWISLQFVPYSFNPKGLPFWLPSFLNKLKGKYHWHVMFHELWLGIDREASFKHKCIGVLQKNIIKRVLGNISPKRINTQNELYLFSLKKCNINASVLPICSNIPLTGIKRGKKEITQFVLFGTIHPGAPFKDFIEDLVINKDSLSRPIKFFFIGKSGSELSSYKAVLHLFKIDYEVLGIQAESVISQILIDSNYGISTTPYFQTEKSGIYAAYKEHQLNSICVSRKWTPINGFHSTPQIIKYEKNNLDLISKGDMEVFDLSSIANQFINSITIK
ncbi:glycosyltransferase [Flavobacterium sp. Arc3]|jgi:hypothetical protein|uniref:glycosyltransferase n=1 Tax=unclassified Flavobacterium TaxID=196869 RepID=UPI00352DEC1E